MRSTAAMVCAYRARATEAGFCDDPWAAHLAGEEGFAAARDYDRAFPHMVLWIGVRTAFIDRCVQRVLASGVDQVVLLGAGFDARSARFQGARFFELDAPAASDEKRRRLASLTGYPGKAELVSCDFERQDFLERIGEAGYRRDRPAVFVLEGVSYYLSETAVESTLRRVADSHPRSLVVFDHVGTRFLRASGGTTARSRDFTASLGEPIVWGCDDPVELVARCGHRWAELTRFDEAALQMTGTYDRDREFRFQSLCVASPTAPW